MEADLDHLCHAGFVRAVLDAIPCGVIVVDGDRRVRQINNVLERVLGVTNQEVLGRRGGEILHCIHAARGQDGQDCGLTDDCRDCEARKAAMTALSENRTYRTKAPLQIDAGGKIQELLLLLSAAPLEFRGERLAVVILENITGLEALQRSLQTSARATIVGEHPRMRELRDLIREAAQFPMPVLIEGESGTGKELVANAVHEASRRAARHFVPVNCAALPQGLLESELFGHVKGAFTHAIRDKKGRFELADGGTIFLDEIGEMDLSLQTRLLRVLQEGAFERVGDTRTVRVDVRVISATNKKLKDEVAAGRFRLDLYYRLCVVPIVVPPLREHIEDIPMLAAHFAGKLAPGFGGGDPPAVSAATLEILRRHHWPGNVRELQNVIQFSLMKSRGRAVLPGHLPAYLNEGDREVGPPRPQAGRKLNAQAVAKALEETQGNKRDAARLLGVSRATLYRFLELSRRHSSTGGP